MAFDAERAGQAFLGQADGDARAALVLIDAAELQFRAAEIDRTDQLNQTRAWICQHHQRTRQPGDIELEMVDGRPMKRLPFASGWSPIGH